MDILIGILGILIVFAVAFLMSNDKKAINWKAIGIMLVIQLVATWLLLGTKVGIAVLSAISKAFGKLVSYGMEGINFVTGGWFNPDSPPFFISVLLVIVFMASLISVLNYLKVIPFLTKTIGGLIAKVTGLPKLESFSAVNGVIFGQSEELLIIKNHLPTLEKNRLFIICVTAMGSVSASIVASYMTMLPPKYVLVALVLNLFSCLMVASVVAPVRKEDVNEEEEAKTDELNSASNVFDAIGQGALDGGKVALIVSAMLIAYLGMLALINGIMNGLVGFDLNTVFSYIFAPIAWLMGVPSSEIMSVGQIMGTKIVANEFVAIMQLQPILDTLSVKAQGILSTFLISFGAFGSIGIIAGSVQAINGAKAKEVSSFGLKMLLVATMSSIVSATIVGLFL